MDQRPYYVQYVDPADGVTKEQFAGHTATEGLRVAAYIQAGGATEVQLVRRFPLGLGFRRAC